MKVTSVIENEDVIRKILKHLVLWDAKARAVAEVPKFVSAPNLEL